MLLSSVIVLTSKIFYFKFILVVPFVFCELVVWYRFSLVEAAEVSDAFDPTEDCSTLLWLSLFVSSFIVVVLLRLVGKSFWPSRIIITLEWSCLRLPCLESVIAPGWARAPVILASSSAYLVPVKSPLWFLTYIVCPWNGFWYSTFPLLT